MSNVRYIQVKLGDNGKLPFREYRGDAGFDLVISRNVNILPHSTSDVHTDISIKMPPFTYGRIIGRSSTMRKHRLMVNEGIIDNGYTGELFISVYNPTNEVFEVKKGMRLAQIIFSRIEDIRWSEIEEIEPNPDERNDRGFGSTGI